MAYPVPYTENIPFVLSAGKEILVDGVVTSYGERFSINICEGPNFDVSSTLLHFNVRFDQNQVVRTHNQGGWGPEETAGGFPFYKGSPYNLRIVVQNHAFQIFVNNTFYCDFYHRMPKEAAKFLHITGNTTINRVSFTEAMGVPIQNPAVPCSIPVPGGVFPGRRIFIDALPTFGQSFSINLVCGPSFEANDVAFHFNPRFNQNEVVRTHKQGGGWGAEEKFQQFFPFFQNTPFSMVIEVEIFGYKVLINGQPFADFNHRIQPTHTATHLCIVGNVKVRQVRFQ